MSHEDKLPRARVIWTWVHEDMQTCPNTALIEQGTGPIRRSVDYCSTDNCARGSWWKYVPVKSGRPEPIYPRTRRIEIDGSLFWVCSTCAVPFKDKNDPLLRVYTNMAPQRCPCCNTAVGYALGPCNP